MVQRSRPGAVPAREERDRPAPGGVPGVHRRELLRLAAGAAGAAALATSGRRAAAVQAETEIAPQGGRVTYGAEGMVFDLFSPVFRGRGVLFSGILYDGLVAIDAETLLPVPNLATEWEVAPDGRTYTFALRPDVRWHDGEPFSAADVKFTYDLYMNAATESLVATVLGEQIAAVEAPEPSTVVFRLTDPLAPFLVDHARYSVVPWHLLGDVAPEDLATHPFTTSRPVGTGPFALREVRTDEYAVFGAHPAYHRGKPAIAEFVFKSVQDSTALYQQLKTGEVDIGYLPLEFYGDAQRQPRFAPVPSVSAAYNFIGFNLYPGKGSPVLQDAQVRQALYYATDRQALVDRLLYGLSTVAVGTIPPSSWAHQPERITLTYPFDPPRAEALLEAAGWTRGADGIRAKGGQRLAFTLIADNFSRAQVGYGLALPEMWRAVGVEATPSVESTGVYSERMQASEFEAAVGSFAQLSVDPDQTQFWGTGGFNNNFGYSNPAVDALLKQGLVTLDLEERKRIYADLQNQLLQDVPAMITDFPQDVWGINTRLQNCVPAAWGVEYDAYRWYVTDGR